MSASRLISYSAEGCPVVTSLSTTRPIRPIGRRGMLARLTLALAMSVLGFGKSGWGQVAIPAAMDLTPKPLPRLQPGIVVGQEQDFGYSDLVTLVFPRLASGEVDSLPEFAVRYASMFNMTILANVVEQPRGDQRAYLLDKIAIGFAMNIGGKMTIVTSDTANDLGANLGMIDRGVLSGNEECLNDVVQIARTDRLVVFDAKANVLIGTKHEPRIIRHFIWASPASGKLGVLIWQLRADGSGDYAIDSPTMQLLPAGFKEDRRIHVSAGNFLSSKIPTPDRFALETIPQGMAVPFGERIKQVAGIKQMTAAELELLLTGASESLAMLQVPSVARKP